jgi:hypothetical protein
MGKELSNKENWCRYKIGARLAAGGVQHVPAPRGGRGGASCLPRQQPHLPVSSVIIK